MQQNIYKTIKILFLISSIFTVGCAERLAAPMGGPWMNYDRRSVGTLTEDQKISVKANVALTKNKDIWKQSHISTLSYNNSILLVGQTPEEDNIETVEA